MLRSTYYMLFSSYRDLFFCRFHLYRIFMTPLIDFRITDFTEFFCVSFYFSSRLTRRDVLPRLDMLETSVSFYTRPSFQWLLKIARLGHLVGVQNHAQHRDGGQLPQGGRGVRPHYGKKRNKNSCAHHVPAL